MVDDPEDLTLRVLQELREEMRNMRIEMQETKEAFVRFAIGWTATRRC